MGTKANTDRTGRQVSQPRRFLLGIDVGSTTVKILARPEDASEFLVQVYQRHEGRQLETVLSALRPIERELGLTTDNTAAFVTGSGGARLGEMLGGRFVQEVTAVSLAVERHFPDARSVIELGGQDSKIIVLQETAIAGQRKKFATMNDKCAGGTGAVIERIASKLNIRPSDLEGFHYDGVELHPVAGKCGVFAETDITGLQKQGVPVEQLMASLFDAIVVQNLAVLTRGHLLLPQVLLLGGPNYFLPGLQEAWRHHLQEWWSKEKVVPGIASDPHQSILVPKYAQYLGAMGAIEYGKTGEADEKKYLGTNELERCLDLERRRDRDETGSRALADSDSELAAFRARYSRPKRPQPQPRTSPEQAFIGIDGGSTSTKAVCISHSGEVLASSYRLSQSDPIADAIGVLQELKETLAESKVPVEIVGAGVTGYSRNLLARVLRADFALVETVAHARSALQWQPDADVIVDVGGQDIKIVLLKDGAVKDFRLNTQCSAGNGYFLQSAAESLGIAVDDFADVAFTARKMPTFSYGCAVFLQSDIVNFHRQGWKPEEILAGLAAVLPKNVFLYVAGVSNLARLGHRFVLQGGTQRNLAVVKAEVDFIRSHFPGELEPEILVHPYCGEAGALGVALHALDRYAAGYRTRFVGLDEVAHIQYRTARDEQTRCSYCANRCIRTFVDVDAAAANGAANGSEPSANRVIIASCERGEAANAENARQFNAARAAVLRTNPNIVAKAARRAFEHPPTQSVASKRLRAPKSNAAGREQGQNLQRSELRIGIPRVLNLYAYAPLFSAYLQSLGVRAENIVYSDVTTAAGYKSALGLAAIDPCFPSKVCASHIQNLLGKSTNDQLDCIFFPMIDVLTTSLASCAGSNACPAGAATPEAVKAMFSLSRTTFQDYAIRYLNPLVDLSDRQVFSFQMFECWKDILGLDAEENARAVATAFAAQSDFENGLRRETREIIDKLEHEGRIGLVLLGRPYHHDPGLNQGILDMLQQLGYPILSQSFLPLDWDLADRLFGEDVYFGIIPSPLAISDVWKISTSASTNHKLWAAKFAARHPNLIPVELSNFKCGHDAFISRVIEQIVETAGKPYFCFRDLDENKPTASLRIRIETMHHFLKHYARQLAETGGPMGSVQSLAQGTTSICDFTRRESDEAQGA